MKIRSDFVTNSSSSSFVIGRKEDENVTIDSVFQTVKYFYKEYLSKRDALIQYITDNPKLGLEYKKSEYGEYYYFKFISGRSWDSKNREIEKAIERDFGISTLDNFYKEYDWLECESYQDYENYWLDKIKADTKDHIYAPFTIADFIEEKEIYWLHVGDCKETHLINSKSYVLDWYFPCAEDEFNGTKICGNYEYENWCYEYEDWCYQEERCYEKVELIRNNTIPEDKACLYLLGRVCIYSECGYIPNYVVKKLEKISNHSCNHMG